VESLRLLPEDFSPIFVSLENQQIHGTFTYTSALFFLSDLATSENCVHGLLEV